MEQGKQDSQLDGDRRGARKAVPARGGWWAGLRGLEEVHAAGLDTFLPVVSGRITQRSSSLICSTASTRYVWPDSVQV